MREGYLFIWRTRGDPEGNAEWWSARHGARNTGAYGTHTRPPGQLRNLRVGGREGRRVLLFEAPGDDWYDRSVDRYRVKARLPSGRRGATWVDAHAAPGKTEAIPIPPGTRSLRVYAVDDAGNRGPARRRSTHG